MRYTTSKARILPLCPSLPIGFNVLRMAMMFTVFDVLTIACYKVSLFCSIVLLDPMIALTLPNIDRPAGVASRSLRGRCRVLPQRIS